MLIARHADDPYHLRDGFTCRRSASNRLRFSDDDTEPKTGGDIGKTNLLRKKGGTVSSAAECRSLRRGCAVFQWNLATRTAPTAPDLDSISGANVDKLNLGMVREKGIDRVNTRNSATNAHCL